MSQDSATTAPAAHGAGNTSTRLYIILTVTAALTAAIAAQTSLLLALPPWAMFMGWVAYFTRRPSAAEGVQSWICTLFGLCLGAVATLTTGWLAPTLGGLAFPVVVFGVAMVVISTRGLPVFSNLLGYFIGLITFFAAHLEPELSTLTRLGTATGIGSVAGWVVQTVEKQVRRAAATRSRRTGGATEQTMTMDWTPADLAPRAAKQNRRRPTDPAVGARDSKSTRTGL